MVISSILDILIDKDGSMAFQASENKMDFVNNWLLMSSPMSPAIILVTYLMFVLKIGPGYMKDKKPYQLQNLMAFYNAIQVILSLYLIYVCGRMFAIHGLISKTCALDTEYNRQSIAAGIHYYLLAKVSELLDTVLFVLRKKSRQISFLHVYHHTLMVIVTWTALKYEPTIHLLFLGMVNSFVHVIMYAYYGLSSFPSLAKYLWWKKYITSLQLIQFIVVLTQFGVAAKLSDCTPSYILTIALSANGFLFLYLFGKFYLTNYTSKEKSNDVRSKIANGGKNNLVNGNLSDKNVFQNESDVISNRINKKEYMGYKVHSDNNYITDGLKNNFIDVKSGNKARK